MEKERPLLKQIIFYLVILLILLCLFLILSTLLMTLVEHKLDVTGDIALNSVMETVRHPISYISSAINERNPIVIVGGLLIIGYTALLFFKSLAKKKSWEVDKNDTHGSARWTDKKELLSSGDYHFASYSNFNSVWKETLK